MNKLRLFLFLFFLPVCAWASIDIGPLLNKVTLQLQAEQWVTTKTALVTVGVNAAVADQDIGQIQTDVMDKLKQLSGESNWHMLSFNRQQDQSGLERVVISADARFSPSELSNLRNKAKAISKPGITFTIDNVAFTPDDDEMLHANAALRNNLYQQAKNEIDALNKMYPDQKFYLYSIDFVSGSSPGPVMPMMMAKGTSNHALAAPVAVGNKVQLQATVVIAAMPAIVAQTLTQH